jgi:hypothetical protein
MRHFVSSQGTAALETDAPFCASSLYLRQHSGSLPSHSDKTETGFSLLGGAFCKHPPRRSLQHSSSRLYCARRSAHEAVRSRHSDQLSEVAASKTREKVARQQQQRVVVSSVANI